MRLTIIEFSFDPCNTYRDCPRGVPRGKQNVVRKRSFAHELLLKTSHSPPIYRYISVAKPELHNGGRTVEGRGLGRGLCPLPRKKLKLNFHQKMVGILVHSKMNFYVYAKLARSMGATHPRPWIRHCYISEIVEDRWVHAARRLTNIEFSFDPCNIYCDGPRGIGYPADARSVGDSHRSC